MNPKSCSFCSFTFCLRRDIPETAESTVSAKHLRGNEYQEDAGRVAGVRERKRPRKNRKTGSLCLRVVGKMNEACV